MKISISVALSLAFAVVCADVAAADTLVLSNTNNGAGYVVPAGSQTVVPNTQVSFDLVMDTTSTNGLTTTTFYTATASQAGTVTFDWTYTDPNNQGAPSYGPYEWAGYVAGLNQSAQVQLAGGGSALDNNNQASGTGTSFSVNAGDTYGLYISTFDSLGYPAADISVTDFNFSPAVTAPGPTPGTGLLSLAALLVAGATIGTRGASRPH
jgi:hypothetical protein